MLLLYGKAYLTFTGAEESTDYRLRRIEGQVRGVQQMLENDAYCNDILVQSAAISAAMNAFNREILAAHIHSCVVRDIREGHDEVVDELVSTIQKLMK